MRSVLRSALLALVAASGAGLAATPAHAVTFTPWPGSPFERPAADGTSSDGAGLQPIDLNADPAPDLVALAGTTNAWYSLPAPTFAPRTFLGLSVAYPQGSAGADIDGDGRLDAFAWGSADKGGGPTEVLRGTPSGPANVLGPDYGEPLRDAAFGDFNGDGRLDLFASETTGVGVRTGKPGATFSALGGDGAARIATPDTTHVAAGDVTGDGKADLLFGGPTQSGLISIRTAPALAAAGLAVGVGTIQDVFLTNVIPDPRPEAVVITASGIKVFPVTAAGQFGTPITTAVALRGGLSAKQSAVADFDKDGDQDLVIVGPYSDHVLLLSSNGNGTFAAPEDVLLPGGSRRSTIDAITSADFDRDGDADLAVSSVGTYRIDVLINGLAVPPTVAAATADQIGFETARVSAPANFRTLGGTAHIEYGETTAYGRSTPDQSFTPTAAGDQGVSAALAELKPEREYHARVVAANGAGTANGPDVTFRTLPAPASDLTVSFTGPDLTVSGIPESFTATASGSFGPYTYDWNFGDAQTASGPAQTHAFAPVAQNPGDAARIRNLGDASDAGEANTRRGSYVVTVTATDRFGRTTEAKRPTTVLPNRAPVTSILPLETPLEYTDEAYFASGSHDPDAPIDRVVREDWAFGENNQSTLTRDPGLPGKLKTCVPTPKGQAPKCIEPGMSATGVRVSPWRDDRHGVAPISKLPALAPGVTPALKNKEWAAWNQQQATLAYALALYPPAACSAQQGSMTGCWPHRTTQKVNLRAVDRGGREVSVSQDVPIRLRAQPAADVNLNTPGIEKVENGNGNMEQTGPIAAGRPDDPANPGTELTFDPGTTVIDSDEHPVWYAVQVGTPWQNSCKEKGDTGPKPPELEQPSKDVLSSLPPIEQLTGGDPNILAGIEIEGLNQQGLALARRTASSAKRVAPAIATAGLGSGTVPVANTPKKTKCLAGFGVNHPVASVVSKDPAALKLTIPKEGEYSALLTVYDRTAATGKVRLDGIKVVAGQLKCSNVARPMGTKQKDRFNWSGTCVDGNNDKQVYWTKSSIDVNGVRMEPSDGSWMVVRKLGGGRGQVFTSLSVPKSTNPGDIDDWVPTGTERPVTILLDDAPVASVTLRAATSGGKGKLFAGPVKWELSHSSDARYGGLPIATEVKIDFNAPCLIKPGNAGGSQIDFEARLPGDFAVPIPGDSKPKAETKGVKIPACNPLTTSVITKVTDTGNYNRVKRAFIGKATTKAAKAKARKVALGGASPEIDMSGLSLGPVYLDSLKLRYDDASKTFTGIGSGTLLEAGAVSIKIVLTNGSLTEAGGTLTQTFPIAGTPMSITRLGFKIVKQNGLTVQGSVRMATTGADLVVANGTLTMQTVPVKLTVDGDASLAGGLIPLATAHIELGDGKGLVRASTGNSIGPFSYAVNIEGSFSTSAFNVEGSGRACIFACLGIEGVLSSKGLAVCGEIDLWIHTFRPGFGYIYASNDLNGYLDGCGLGPYRAVVGSLPSTSGGVPSVSATRAELANRAATLQPGQSQTVEVEPGQKVLSLVARGTPGTPPKVTLTGPTSGACFENKCAASNVVTTPDALDNYGFNEANNSVVDVDRVKGEVRFMIAGPRVGKWTVSADATSATVSGVAYARDQDLPKAGDFKAQATKVSAKDHLDGKLYGTLASSTAKQIPTAKKQALGVGAKTLITGNRLSPKAIGSAYDPLLRKLTVNASALPVGDTVTFVERGADTSQTVAAFSVPSTGKLAATFGFLPGVIGAPDRHIDAYITSPSGIPRGVVHDVDTFKASPPPSPKVPSIAGIKSVGGRKVAVTVKSEPAFGLKSSMPVMRLGVARRNGGYSTVVVTGADFKKRGKVWVATVKAGGDAKGAKVGVTAMTASGAVAKGPGRKVTAKVR